MPRLGAYLVSVARPLQGKDMWSSSHFVTGVIGLVLLGLQGMLSAFFEVRLGAPGVGRPWVGRGHLSDSDTCLASAR